jgi:hypothetical protein
MSTRRFSFDLELNNPDAPEAGDLFTTARTDYLVTLARPVDSKKWGNRWHIEARSLGTRDQSRQAEPPHHHWFSGHYAKGETPAQFFGVPWP